MQANAIFLRQPFPHLRRRALQLAALNVPFVTSAIYSMNNQ
jgi:hypothetical protein